MSRKQRRALARFLGRAREDRHTTKTADLEAQVLELQARLDGLESKHDQLPGVREERKDWFVLVAGERVELRALPPIEWVKSLEELPSFLFTFATEKLTKPGETLPGEVIEQIVNLAKRWIAASAVDPDSVRLDRLTVTEAEHAVAHIATLNGVTDSLRKWFRGRLEGVAGGAPGSESVRATPESPAGDKPN